MPEWGPEAYYIANFIVQWAIRIGIGLLIVMRRRSPASALAWLVLVAMLPIPGMILYFLIGENRLGARDVERYRRVVDRVEHSGRYSRPDQRFHHPDIPINLRPIANLAHAYGGSRPLGGNTVEFIDETKGFIDGLVADLDEARTQCHLLYYIFTVDDYARRVAEALMRAAERGVACRLIADAVGSDDLIDDDLWYAMKNAGVQVAEALPVHALRARVARLDLRNHRKLAVIDGRIAYSGSHNISTPIYPKKEAFGAWVDATMRMVGPIVAPLQRMFIEDWALSTGELLPDHDELLPGDPDVTEPGVIAQSLPTGPLSPEAPLQQVLLHALHMAREEVIFTTPYFVPDEATVNALCATARRGARVIMVVPKRSDNWITQAAGRSHYGKLLDDGVEIHEYTAGLLHAKTLTVDRAFGLIGTANVDLRSFYLNFEIAVLIYSTDSASELRFLQKRYMSESEPLNVPHWRARPWRYRLGDNLAKLMSPLL